MDDCLGRLVVSSAGRDKGCICVIVGIGDEPGYVLVADGRLRKVENPKKKKLKHTKPIEGIGEEDMYMSRDRLTNRFIREHVNQLCEKYPDILL